jgi:hypothetical protein
LDLKKQTKGEKKKRTEKEKEINCIKPHFPSLTLGFSNYETELTKSPNEQSSLLLDQNNQRKTYPQTQTRYICV